MQELVTTLILWLSLHKNMVIIEKPHINIIPTQEMVLIYKKPAYAIYDYTTSTIFLQENININSYRGKSIILHELVHHWQKENNKLNKVGCIRQLERLAYNIQKDYLIYYSQPVMKELNNFNILMRSSCEEDYLL